MTKTEEKRINKMTMLRKRLAALVPADKKDEAALLVSSLLAEQTVADIEAVELVVPTASVADSIDLGAVTLSRTSHGVLFQTKGGYSVFVDIRMQGLYDLLCLFIDGYKTSFADPNPEAAENKRILADAWQHILMAPLICALDTQFAIDTATSLLEFLDRYAATLSPQAGAPSTDSPEQPAPEQ